jgi:carotenoid cleavage dioxygenase
MALWEGGSAYELDPQTMATRGPKVWSRDYAGVAFSAHPKVEPDGTLWNFGITSFRGLLSVYRVEAGGALAQAVTLPVKDIAMVHDFAITERHLVFLLPPLVLITYVTEFGSSRPLAPTMTASDANNAGSRNTPGSKAHGRQDQACAEVQWHRWHVGFAC